MNVPWAARQLLRADDVEAARIADSADDGANPWRRLLDRYLEGWADVNPHMIFAATTPDYCFNDPLVGLFSRWSIPTYLARLQSRFARVKPIAAQDLAVFIRGPMDGSQPGGPLKFVREAPWLGLTGISFITIADGGVIEEKVEYDLNSASDLLRQPT